MELSGSPVRMSEMEWREIILTERGLGVQIGWDILSMDWNRYG